MAARVSQEAVEVLITTEPNARVSQEAVEVLIQPNTAAARVSQIAVEVLILNVAQTAVRFGPAIQ